MPAYVEMLIAFQGCLLTWFYQLPFGIWDGIISEMAIFKGGSLILLHNCPGNIKQIGKLICSVNKVCILCSMGSRYNKYIIKISCK